MAIELAVLVPFNDVRGDLASHLRTWTHEQTLARDRYQLVIGANKGDRELEREIAGLLQPHDRYVRVDEIQGEPSLWNVAAAHADAPWLLITEAHCLGDPGCLEAIVRAIEADPEFDAALLSLGHVAEGVYRHLFPRWFDETRETWDASEFRMLPLLGTVIRADLFREVGGFVTRYGEFCEAMLSARVHERGGRVRDIPDAVVRHIHNENLRDHHDHSMAYARGGCDARADHDAAYCERYFGYDPFWGNRLRYEPVLAGRATAVLGRLSRQALGGAGRSKAWAAGELLRWLPARVAGARPQLAWERAAFLATEFAAEHIAAPPRIRYRLFLEAHRRAVRQERLRWITENRGGVSHVEPLTGVLGVDELDGRLIGAHGLETHSGRRFRWTEPAAILRLATPPGAHVLTIDTGGLRGSPLGYVQAVFAGDTPVPADRVREREDHLLVDLPADQRVDAITVIARPLKPSRHGSSDARRLGMPVFSVGLEPLGS